MTFSSGDSGVAGEHESSEAYDPTLTGLSSDADNDDQCLGPNNSTRFSPAFPAACPYVTTVGGTQNIPNEVAVSRFGSGAGFSDYWPMPDWQKSAVSGYLNEKGNQTLLEYYSKNNIFNASGRAYPDVAALGDRFAIYVPSLYNPRNGNSSGWGLIGGTSASSPTFASILSQLVDYRLSQGKKPFGWFNPLLYVGNSLGHFQLCLFGPFGSSDIASCPQASRTSPKVAALAVTLRASQPLRVGTPSLALAPLSSPNW